MIDTKSEPTRESRALAAHPCTMEISAQLGLADLQRDMIPIPGITIFEQSHNEELLAATLTAAGDPPRWRHRLVDLTTDPDGVTALVDTPTGLSRISARWCIGAAGARSLVRRLRDIPFDGVTDEATFWVADVRGVSGLPSGVVTPKFGGQTFVAGFPLDDRGAFQLVSIALSEHVEAELALRTAAADVGVQLPDHQLVLDLSGPSSGGCSIP